LERWRVAKPWLYESFDCVVGLGVVLAVAAMIPGLGRVAYLAVYVPSILSGYFVSKVILFIVFFLVFVPIGALLKCSGKTC